eukprot:10555282-Prorocentrum_lima.AAC.1
MVAFERISTARHCLNIFGEELPPLVMGQTLCYMMRNHSVGESGENISPSDPAKHSHHRYQE